MKKGAKLKTDRPSDPDGQRKRLRKLRSMYRTYSNAEIAKVLATQGEQHRVQRPQIGIVQRRTALEGYGKTEYCETLGKEKQSCLMLFLPLASISPLLSFCAMLSKELSELYFVALMVEAEIFVHDINRHFTGTLVGSVEIVI